jgi:hypothetical protein
VGYFRRRSSFCCRRYGLASFWVDMKKSTCVFWRVVLWVSAFALGAFFMEVATETIKVMPILFK